jgi:hypothetical protein
MHDADVKLLHTHIVILEAALRCIQAECALALQVPEVSFATTCRVASVARQVLPGLAKTSGFVHPLEGAGLKTTEIRARQG